MEKEARVSGKRTGRGVGNGLKHGRGRWRKTLEYQKNVRRGVGNSVKYVKRR